MNSISGGRADYQRRSDGFTLIEVLVVVLILGILAATIVLAAQQMQSASGVSACKADYKTIEMAQEAYRGQVGRSASSFVDLLGRTTGITGSMVGPWIKEAPRTGDGYVIGFDLNPGGTFGDITVATSNPPHAAEDGSANCAFA